MTSLHGTTLNIDTPAKLNLFLDIHHLRPDGYHELETLMVPIAIYDTLNMIVSDIFKFTCDNPEIPLDISNTICKTIALTEKILNRKFPLEIHLNKRIPHGSGLGGASSDAAACLQGLNQLYELNLSTNQAETILAEVGSDTVFFWQAQSAICRGRGELVDSIPAHKKLFFVVAVPDINISTKKIFKAYKRQLTTNIKNSIFTPLNKVNIVSFFDDDNTYEELMVNRLETTSLNCYPTLCQYKDDLEKFSSSKAHMTGSGSGFFMRCKNKAETERLAKTLTEHLEGSIFATSTC